MAELRGGDGVWTVDGDAVRIVPSQDRMVHPFRQVVGELAVPLEAVAGPATAADRCLTPPPPVPAFATANDGTASFDGRVVRLEWNWMAELRKR